MSEGSLRSDLAIWLRKEGRLAEAAASAERALREFESLYGPDNWQCSATLNNLGNIHVDAGDYPRAEAAFQRALAIAEGAYGPEHAQVARLHNNLANALNMRGEHEAALASASRALEVQERVLGESHPEIATTLNVLASIQLTLGRWADARRTQERALAMQEKAGETRAGWSLLGLARLDREEGKLESARQRANRGLEIFVKGRGPDSPAAASAHLEIARVELAAGRLAVAAEHAARAESLRATASARDHAEAIVASGDVLLAQGRRDQALARYQGAQALLEKALPEGDAELAAPLVAIGEALLGAGRAGEAVAPLERAVQLRDGARGGPLELARARFALARARADRALAEGALALLAPLGPEVAPALRRDLAAWLRTRR